MNVGLVIRARRERCGWSLTDLAGMVGVGQALIEQVEAGRPLPGRPDVVHAVLDVLDITAQVMWRQVLEAAGARTTQVDVGWVPMTVEMAVIADVATPERMEQACESVYGTSHRPPGLVVASHSNGEEGEGEEESLGLASTMGEWFGPAYQVRNEVGFSLFWAPSLLTLQRWDSGNSGAPAAMVRTAAGTALTITPPSRGCDARPGSPGVPHEPTSRTGGVATAEHTPVGHTRPPQRRHTRQHTPERSHHLDGLPPPPDARELLLLGELIRFQAVAAEPTGASRGPCTDPYPDIPCCSAFQPKAQAGGLSGCEKHWCSLWLRDRPGLPLSARGRDG